MSDKCAACGEWIEPVVFGDGSSPGRVCECGFDGDEGDGDFESRVWVPSDVTTPPRAIAGSTDSLE